MQLEPLAIIFTRLPKPGQAKTRMIPALGPAGAADLQRQMTEHCLRQLDQAACSLRIDYTGDDLLAMQAWLGQERSYVPQAAGDLGARLQHSFTQGFAAGHPQVLAIGADVPGIRPRHIAQAISALDHSDVVIGPASDGGYWLIGCKSNHAELWQDMPWGTDQVATLTRQRCQEAGLRLSELETLSDVDLPQDLPVWQAEQDKLS